MSSGWWLGCSCSIVVLVDWLCCWFGFVRYLLVLVVGCVMGSVCWIGIVLFCYLYWLLWCWLCVCIGWCVCCIGSDSCWCWLVYGWCFCCWVGSVSVRCWFVGLFVLVFVWYGVYFLVVCVDWCWWIVLWCCVWVVGCCVLLCGLCFVVLCCIGLGNGSSLLLVLWGDCLFIGWGWCCVCGDW